MINKKAKKKSHESYLFYSFVGKETALHLLTMQRRVLLPENFGIQPALFLL